jgi:hypothetical protein
MSENTAKKSNAGLIVAIIVAALIIAGGVVAAVLLIPQLTNGNNGNNDGDSNSSQTADDNGGDNKGGKSGDDKYTEPAQVDDAYFIKIDGEKYTYRSKLSDLSKSGYEVNDKVKDQNVPAGKYMIMIGGGYLTNKENDTDFKVTPYNDSSNDTTFPNAMLGSVTISDSYDKDEQAILEKIEFYGGIHLGSTREELIEVFGEPSESKEYDNYKGGKYEKIEFQAKTWKEFEFQIEDGKVTEMTWTNYGKLNR